MEIHRVVGEVREKLVNKSVGEMLKVPMQNYPAFCNAISKKIDNQMKLFHRKYQSKKYEKLIVELPINPDMNVL